MRARIRHTMDAVRMAQRWDRILTLVADAVVAGTFGLCCLLVLWALLILFLSV